MANFVSPGVYTIEKDVSDYAPSINPSIVGLVGFASRGPTDTATLVTTPADLIRTFGTPDLVEGGQGLYGALEILQKTNQVYFVRSATTQAKSARQVVNMATQPHSVVNVGVMSANIVYRFDLQAFDMAHKQLGEKTSVYVYRERQGCSGNAGGSIYPAVASGDMNDSHWHDAWAAGISRAFDSETGQMSYVPSGYGQASGLLASKAPGGDINKASYFTAETYFASGGAHFGGGAGGIVPAYLSSTPIDVTDLTFAVAPASGDDAPDYTNMGNAFKIFQGAGGPEDNLIDGNPHSAPSSVLTANLNAPSGVTFLASGAQGAYSVDSLYPGLGYNYSAVNYKGGLVYRGLKYKTANFNNGGQVDLNVESDGGTEETFRMAIAKPVSTTSATSLWPEDVLTQGLINSNSNYVKGNFYQFSASNFNVNSANPNDYAFSANISGIPTWQPPASYGDEITFVGSYAGGGDTAANYQADASKSWRCLTFQGADYEAKGGKNGDASDYNGNMSNTNVVQALVGTTGDKTGINALDNESTPITIASVPGCSNQSVQNELISLAESTQNFLAVVSPPVGFRGAQQAIDWSNGEGTGRTAAINSSYAAVYWPWVKQFDAFTGADRWYDPSIYAIGQMCFTDEVADPWFAPAGLQRGRLTQPIDVEVKLNQGDRDALYGPGNIINPITKFNQDGIVIYGQRTGQRAATALDRINVRRMMIFLRRLVLQGTRRFVFEPNDPVTWEAVRSVLNPALADIQQRRGITQFKVVCDSTTNTPLRVDRNELWCKVIIKPTKTAEMLVFELNLTNQSASV
tara:strand:- start:3538 stop:5943 length:2406 start_codon:yes stop_codon:yes gene_type:complete